MTDWSVQSMKAVRPTTLQPQTLGAPRSLNGGNSKRERILAAGLKLFAGQPYEEVTMDQVAKLAGVAKGTLYLYFHSKESLYQGILVDGMEAATRSYQAAVDPGASPEERLLRTIAVTMEFYASRRDLLQLLATSEPRMAAIRNRVIGGWRERGMKFFTSLIEEGIAARRFRQSDPRLATLAIMGAIRSALLYYGSRRPVTELSRDLARLVLDGIVARPARPREASLRQ